MVKVSCTYCRTVYDVFPSRLRQSWKRNYCSSKCKYADQRKYYGEYKPCTCCGQNKEKSQFYKDKSLASGLSSICKDCTKNRNREWYRNNKERANKRHKDYQRNYRLNGKKADGKRHYPNDQKCELCKKKKHLAYHHWDDSDFSKGIWVCVCCHKAAHWLDENDPERYYMIKQLRIFAADTK